MTDYLYAYMELIGDSWQLQHRNDRILQWQLYVLLKALATSTDYIMCTVFISNSVFDGRLLEHTNTYADDVTHRTPRQTLSFVKQACETTLTRWNWHSWCKDQSQTAIQHGVLLSTAVAPPRGANRTKYTSRLVCLSDTTRRCHDNRKRRTHAVQLMSSTPHACFKMSSVISVSGGKCLGLSRAQSRYITPAWHLHFTCELETLSIETSMPSLNYSIRYLITV